jgi:hypothetical protein
VATHLRTSVFHTASTTPLNRLRVISGFRRDADKVCALLRHYAALSGSSVATFRDILSLPYSRVKTYKKKAFFLDFLTLEPLTQYRRFGTTYRSHLKGSRNPRRKLSTWTFDSWRCERQVVPKRRYRITTQRSVISQNSADLIQSTVISTCYWITYNYDMQHHGITAADNDDSGD